uniref:Large ribosomal subunit protein bL21 n=1 Tax=uncultured Thiotrichaceae bacterium TaxID=298394 RepID=A0A6S6UD42_9GAMM|nr:MAG: LSU ribosomal protein L21p [uncultured Thiotrichaceae bacterium]
MYAVIATGGKQYRVAKGDVIQIEKLDAEEGSNVDFDNVLMVGEGEDVKIGAPYVEGSKVVATVKSQMRGEKIEIMKFRRRKHHQKRTGHRQYLTQIEIQEITG